MQMNPCPFCGATTRLGVVTKWLRVNGVGAKRGAYARCKVCNARGSLVVADEGEYDIRNERPSKLATEALIDKAVIAWNKAGSDAVKNAVAGLPLYELPLFKREGCV